MKQGGLLALAVVAAFFSAHAEVPYRTDTAGEKLPWFQPRPGEFPPEDAAHEMAGELISFDPLQRSGVLRQDRGDAIARHEWDRPLPFVMLPYGSLSYHGAPAELRDIPLGTHLHALIFWQEKVPPEGKAAFRNVLRLEDDFSYFARQQHSWHLDKVAEHGESIDVTPKGFTAKPTNFKLSPATQYWSGRTLGTWHDLAAGQDLLINLTVCTLKGPGRGTEVWLDEAARAAATEHQLEAHRLFEHEHGLPGWIEEVDNQAGVLGITLFGGFDPKLLEDFRAPGGIAVAVAEENLRTYDQNNDTGRGDLLEIQKTPPGPGTSGVRFKFKPQILLEGYRPHRIVRVFAGGWRVDDLPLEERLYQ